MNFLCPSGWHSNCSSLSFAMSNQQMKPNVHFHQANFFASAPRQWCIWAGLIRCSPLPWSVSSAGRQCVCEAVFKLMCVESFIQTVVKKVFRTNRSFANLHYEWKFLFFKFCSQLPNSVTNIRRHWLTRSRYVHLFTFWNWIWGVYLV